ncbi:hypothetical protein B9Z42_16010 [Limnohabitans sp. B9-3]|nr:hypothetical protein B9Z42_16010 [Limnohabitans sp. B9-3]
MNITSFIGKHSRFTKLMLTQLLNSDSTQASEAIQMISEIIKSYKKRTIDKKSTSELIHEIIFQYHSLDQLIRNNEQPEYISFRYFFWK